MRHMDKKRNDRHRAKRKKQRRELEKFARHIRQLSDRTKHRQNDDSIMTGK